ncbi:unnamed protein product [Protopolystoma xenopodis]|uniref:Uncharacterized protein n=1 Tax=Protopolystoma xenopodis TaxID=117903 RepID=A0A3S5CT82_9PLAT|nr:unnamed protein product [Protopolystoma xenopodis]
MFTYLQRRFSSGDLQGELADKREQEGFPGFLNFTQTLKSATVGAASSGAPVARPQATGVNTQAFGPGQVPANRSGCQAAGTYNQHHRYTGGSSATEKDAAAAAAGGGFGFSSVGGVAGNTGSSAAGAIASSGTMFKGRGAYPSAPSSPTRTLHPAMQSMDLSRDGAGATPAGIGMADKAGGNPTSGGRAASFMSMGPMGSITGSISSTITRGIFSAASTAQGMATGKSYNKDKCKILLVIDEPHTDW